MPRSRSLLRFQVIASSCLGESQPKTRFIDPLDPYTVGKLSAVAFLSYASWYVDLARDSLEYDFQV